MDRFGHLAQRLFNRPLMIHPRKAEIVMAALADRLRIAHVPAVAYADDGFYDAPAQTRTGRDYGYDMAGPVAVIPVHGTLVQKSGYLRPASGMTGYDGIRQAFAGAMNDDAVEAIVFDIDSPGGEVGGNFDLADDIYAARGIKPMRAVLTEDAFSAAYLIASAVDPGGISVPRTGGTGSIGTLWLHMDWSRAIDEDGLKVTPIHYGAKKVDGYPQFELSESALADGQAEINIIGELFVDTVARNRGIAASAVKATQAGTYMGAAGISVGLADAARAPDAAFRALLADLA